MHRIPVILWAVAAFAFAEMNVASRAPVARVVELHGTATVAEVVEGEHFARPLMLYGTVYADEQLVLDADARATLVFRADGHIERVAKPGTYQVKKTGCEPAEGVERVAMPEQKREVIGKLSKGSRGIVQGGVVLARAPAPPSSDDTDEDAETPFEPDWSKISPRRDATLLAANPKFTWYAVPNAEKYTLKLYYLGNQVWTTEVKQSETTYDGEEPLTAAGTYWWEATATIDGKSWPVCESSFRMASEHQCDEAAEIEKMLKTPDPISLAIAAMWYRQNDMTTEAVAANEQLAKLAPSAAVYRELSELYYQLGRDQDGDAAAVKAEKLEKEKTEKN